MAHRVGDLELPVPIFPPESGLATGDPVLDTLLDFFGAVITADCGGAWATLLANQPVVKRRFAHNPANEAFKPQTTPALYLWRESTQRARNITAGWRVRPSRLTLRWVPPAAIWQDKQRRWEPFTNAVVSALDLAVERGRHPAWTHGETGEQSEFLGSLLYDYIRVHKLEIAREDVRRTTMSITMEGNAPALSYEVLDIPIDLEELVETDPAAAYDELSEVSPFMLTQPTYAAIGAFAPTLTGLSLTSAVAGTGLHAVHLTGTNLFVTSVAYLDGAALGTSWVSETELVAYVPATTPGTHLVTVRGPMPGGTTAETAPLAFEVTAALPSVSSISPTIAHLSDSFTLTVTGANFTPTTLIRVGASAKVTTFVSAAQLTAAVAPSTLPLGTPAVDVANEYGTSNALALTVDHAAPALTSLSSYSSAASAGAQTITLTGTGFDTSTTVLVDGVSVATTYLSPLSLSAVIPGSVISAPGPKAVAVVNPAPGGGTSGAVTFTSIPDAPTVTALSPMTMHLSDGPTTLTVDGTNFTPTTTIRIDGVAKTTTYVSTTRLTCSVSPSTYSVAAHVVDVSNNAGTSGTLPLSIDHAAPTASALSLTGVYVGASGQVVTVTGTGFDAATVAKVDGVSVSTTIVDATHVSFTLATQTAVVTRAITVTNPAPGGGTSGALSLNVTWRVDFTAVNAGPLSAGALLTLGSGGLVLTRASSATVQDSALSVVTAGIGVDVARVSDIGGGKKGLRIEEARSNVIQYARDLSQLGGVAWGGAFTRTAGQTGVDGTSVAYRIDVTSGNALGENTGSNPAGGPTTASTWLRSLAGAAVPNVNLYRSLTGRIATAAVVGTTFQRVSISGPTGSETVSLCPVDGRDWSTLGGIGAGARAFVVDGCQRELGGFPTSLIVTAGATGTRAGERLRHDTPASLLASGRFSLEVVLWAEGASTEYSANLRVWTFDVSNYAEIDKTTRVLTVVIGGVARNLGALPVWSRDSKIELFIAAGGGAIGTKAKVRIDGGTVTDLGTGAAQAAVTPAGAVEFMCSGTSAQFSCMAASLEAFPANGSPAWAA